MKEGRISRNFYGQTPTPKKGKRRYVASNIVSELILQDPASLVNEQEGKRLPQAPLLDVKAWSCEDFLACFIKEGRFNTSGVKVAE